MKNRMQLQLSLQKRRQFKEEVRLRWNLDETEFLHNAGTANEIISILHETVGLSLPRAERELGEMMRNFEEKVRRAA